MAVFPRDFLKFSSAYNSAMRLCRNQINRTSLIIHRVIIVSLSADYRECSTLTWDPDLRNTVHNTFTKKKPYDNSTRVTFFLKTVKTLFTQRPGSQLNKSVWNLDFLLKIEIQQKRCEVWFQLYRESLRLLWRKSPKPTSSKFNSSMVSKTDPPKFLPTSVDR